VVCGSGFALLCDDCVAVLFHGQSVLREAHGLGHVKLTVVGDRDVA